MVKLAEHLMGLQTPIKRFYLKKWEIRTFRCRRTRHVPRRDHVPPPRRRSPSNPMRPVEGPPHAPSLAVRSADRRRRRRFFGTPGLGAAGVLGAAPSATVIACSAVFATRSALTSFHNPSARLKTPPDTMIFMVGLTPISRI